MHGCVSSHSRLVIIELIHKRQEIMDLVYRFIPLLFFCGGESE